MRKRETGIDSYVENFELQIYWPLLFCAPCEAWKYPWGTFSAGESLGFYDS